MFFFKSSRKEKWHRQKGINRVLNTKLESKVWIASKKNEAKLWNKSLLGEELLSPRTLIEYIDLGVVFPSQYRKS